MGPGGGGPAGDLFEGLLPGHVRRREDFSLGPRNRGSKGADDEKKTCRDDPRNSKATIGTQNVKSDERVEQVPSKRTKVKVREGTRGPFARTGCDPYVTGRRDQGPV
ncbi:uncharacterized protein LOC112493811 [Cephus cinctus]|uniref:Uncharacterized protein LOC112493811 n=1 Tax=Cephus cinctus TaxID=211228 RepID=A0AAJ7VY21_CEPCN|nr:uncharacterized protein LOC112493811 [Cephus cinctus]